MSLSGFSIRHPVPMVCLLIALTFMGLNSFRKMPLEQLPKFDIPYITVITTWVGATPQDLEVDVAKKIEDAVSSLDGLKHVTSTCMENVCLTQLEFELDQDVDTCAVELREKIDAILDDLPSGCERPVIEKINVNSTSAVTLCLTGDATIDELYDYADNTLADRFSTVPGTAKVELIGGNKREVHVELNREQLAAAGLTSAHVIQALKANVLSLPAGRVKEHGQEVSVKFDAEYATVNEIANLEVANIKGNRRYIKDLGTVTLGSEEKRDLAFIDSRPCIILKIIKKGETNAVKLVNTIRQRVEDIRPNLPGGMELVWFSDNGEFVESTVKSTLDDIITGIIICGALLFIFLGNIRATFIAVITMPLTIIISMFFIEQIFDYSLNLSTLLATGLSVGILVSNSIVVLENIVKRLQDYEDPWEAARVGTEEVALAVAASAGTNVVVMLPIGMMSSVIGLFFAPFAVTTLILNIASIFISLTLTPILCAVILKPEKQNGKQKESASTKWMKMQQNLADAYANIIRKIANSRMIIAIITIATIILFIHSLTLVPELGFNFTEDSDRGRIFIKAEFPTDYTLEKSNERILDIQKKILDKFGDETLQHSLASTGKVDAVAGAGSQAVYLSQIQLQFVDKTKRDWSIFDRIKQIDELLSDETDCIFTIAIESVMGGLAFPIEIQIAGDDLEQLEQLGAKVRGITMKQPGAANIDTTIRDGKQQLKITPKRATISDLGMTAAQLATIMRGNLEGIEAATFKRGDRSFDIRVKFKEQPGKDQVKGFMLPGSDGKPVALEAVANVEPTLIPIQIERIDKIRMVRIMGTMQEGGKLGNILSQVQKEVEESNLLPPGYEFKVAGMGEMMSESVLDFLEALILATFLTYLTLAAILESFTRPIIIMLTIPLGAIGIFWSLKLADTAISIFVMLGIVMLIGVVVNAAVLIIDRMNQLVEAAHSKRNAMIQALSDTFRAVLMLVLASGLGMLPMALASGIGSELRAGIGIASTGGVVVAGILTMTVLPLTFLFFTAKSPEDRRK